MDSSVVLRPDGRSDVVENRRLRAGRPRCCSAAARTAGTASTSMPTALPANRARRRIASPSASGRSRETAYARDYDRLDGAAAPRAGARQRGLGHGPGLRLRRGRPPRHAGPDRKRLLQRPAGRQRPGDARPGGRVSAHGPGTGHLHPAVRAQRTLQPPGRAQPRAPQRLHPRSSSTTDHIDNGILYLRAPTCPSCWRAPSATTGRCRRSRRTRTRRRTPCARRCAGHDRHLHGHHAPHHRHRQHDALFRVLPDGTVRPVYLYAVDAAEFVVNKLHDRGSLAATTSSPTCRTSSAR